MAAGLSCGGGSRGWNNFKRPFSSRQLPGFNGARPRHPNPRARSAGAAPAARRTHGAAGGDRAAGAPEQLASYIALPPSLRVARSRAVEARQLAVEMGRLKLCHPRLPRPQSNQTAATARVPQTGPQRVAP